MVTETIPAAETDEVEAWLWAQREAVAESWEPDAEPGAGDGAWLEIDPVTPAVARFVGAQLHREALLGEWQQAHAAVARWQGVQVRILADALDLVLAEGACRSDTTLAVRSLAAELGLAVGVSDRTIEAQLNDAQVLRDRFSATYETLRDGRIARPHAQVISDEGIRLADETVRAEYEQIVLQIAPHLTTGRLRAAAKAIAEQLMPLSIDERHKEARSLRRVVVRDTGDGMAELWALLPAALAHGIHDRLTQFGRTVQDAERDAARAAKSAAREAARETRGVAMKGRRAGDSTLPQPDVSGRPATPDRSETPAVPKEVEAPEAPEESEESEARSLDQLRADILCDLLLTAHATTATIDRDGGEGIDAIRAIVQITIPLPVLTGTAGTSVETGTGPSPSAWLTGRGHIDADSARRLAAAATVWNRIFTDPATGAVLTVDRRFPTKRQRRFLRARDEHCRFPGCRQPVWRCDVDHTVDHQHGGPTTVCNLAHLCRRHHVMKHQTAWRVEQQDSGALVWTSPLGRVYTDTPASTLRFVPARA